MTSIYVGNLAHSATEDDLRQAFAQYGEVAGVNIIKDRETGRPRGFAFVEMSTQEEANKAVAEFNGKEFDGRALTVNEAKPREERPRGGFGPRPGGGGGGRRDFGGGRGGRY